MIDVWIGLTNPPITTISNPNQNDVGNLKWVDKTPFEWQPYLDALGVDTPGYCIRNMHPNQARFNDKECTFGYKIICEYDCNNVVEGKI